MTRAARRRAAWLFAGALLTVLAAKAAQMGWLAARPPLELGGQPALLFFNSQRGCECALVVYRSAEAQVAAWPAAARAGVAIVPIDVDRRPDRARQYQVVRAPTLLLLDGQGVEIWRQDESVSDEAPLDLRRFEARIAALPVTGSK